MALDDFRVTVTIPVAWGDMDAFGHVNNTRYFRYFESARIAYFEAMGALGGGVGPILGSTSCRFRAPVTYPDTLIVGARIADVGEDRFTMEHAAWSTALGRLAASGDAVVVCYDYAAGRKAPLPGAWREAISAFEPQP